MRKDLKNRKMDYLDRVLIKLKRRYSENEVIAALNKKLSELEIELGMIKSERDEARYLLKKQNRKFKCDHCRATDRRNKKLREENDRLRKANTELISKQLQP